MPTTVQPQARLRSSALAWRCSSTVPRTTPQRGPAHPGRVRAGGRFTLGVGIGVRDDDDRAAGVPDRGRGARMDEQMARLRSLWARSDRPRCVRADPRCWSAASPRRPWPGRPFGDGLLCAAQPAWAAGLFAAVARSWVEYGRSGAPRNVGQARRLDGLAIHQSRLTFVQTYGAGAWGLLGDPSRRAIFELLGRSAALGKASSPTELPISQPAVSQHLRVLREGRPRRVSTAEGTRRGLPVEPPRASPRSARGSTASGTDAIARFPQGRRCGRDPEIGGGLP